MSASTRRADGERGAVAVIFAIAMTVVMFSVALSFDIGRLIDNNRAVQAIADTVALTAADGLTGQSTTTTVDAAIVGENLPVWNFIDSLAAAEATDGANAMSFASSNTLTIAIGTWTSSAGFSAISGCTATYAATTSLPIACSSAVPNAVQVTVSEPTAYDFAPGTGQSTRSATAVRNYTTSAGTSSFTVGAYLAQIDSNSGPLLNALLDQTLGSSINLTVANANGLAGGSVALGDLLTANPAIGSMTALLTTSYPPSTLLGYYANALSYRAAKLLSASQSTAAAALQGAVTALSSISPLVTSKASVELCQMLDISPGTNACSQSASSAAYTSVNGLQFLQTLAEVADGSNALAFSAGLAGTLSVKATAIAPVSTSWCASCSPQSAIGPAKQLSSTTWATTATNTQVQLQLSASALSVTVGMTVQGATATGNLTAVSCGPTQAAGTATLSVSTNAAIINPLSVSVLGLGLVTSSVAGGGTSSATPTPLTFTGPITGQSPAQSVSPTATPLAITGTVLGVLNVNLQNVLGGINNVLSPLLTALGVSVGGANVQDDSISCGATLVQ